MHATEARKKALEIVETRDANQLAHVRQGIEKAVKEGKFQTNYFDPLYMEVKARLEEDGYSVYEHSDQKDGTTVTITW